VNSEADPALLGIYYILNDGTLEYVGGKLEGDTMTVLVDQFSKYAALEYHVSFDDVKATDWAAKVIQAAAAKDIIEGVGANRFAPKVAVSRAEFAAMLVRSLDL
jgi:hypothetical protein